MELKKNRKKIENKLKFNSFINNLSKKNYKTTNLYY